MAEDSTPPTKRRRVTKACDQCTKRRQKCEGSVPSCAGCVAQGKPEGCTYSKPAKRRGPAAGYSQAARAATERVRLLQLVLGDLILLAPQIMDLVDCVVGRRTTCSLVPNPVPPRSEEARQEAWAASAGGHWVEEKIATFLEDTPVQKDRRLEPERDSPPIPRPTPESSPAPLPAPSHASQPPSFLDNHPFISSSAHDAPFPDLPSISQHDLIAPSNPPSSQPLIPPFRPTASSSTYFNPDDFGYIPMDTSPNGALETGWSPYDDEGLAAIFGVGTGAAALGSGHPIQPDRAGAFDIPLWGDPDEVLRALGASGPPRPSASDSHDPYDIDFSGRWSSRGIVEGDWGWGVAPE